MKKTPVIFGHIPELSHLRKAWPQIRALFFDMDGTLFNTEPYHSEAMLQIGATYNIKAPFSREEVHQLLVGRADHLVFDIIRKWDGFPHTWTARDFVNEKNKQIIKILQSVNPDSYFLPQMKHLLREARESQLYLALVTSSEKAVTEELLKLTGLTDFFHLTLTRDDCEKVKPHPWPYLKALESFGGKENEALIFEDSSVGIEAAVESGANVAKAQWY